MWIRKNVRRKIFSFVLERVIVCLILVVPLRSLRATTASLPSTLFLLLKPSRPRFARAGGLGDDAKGGDDQTGQTGEGADDDVRAGVGGRSGGRAGRGGRGGSGHGHGLGRATRGRGAGGASSGGGAGSGAIP